MRAKLIFIIFFFFFLTLAGLANAGDSVAVVVNATVTGNCKFTGSAPMNFSLDPASNSDALATGSVTFWCTKNSLYALTVNAGLHASGIQKRLYDGSANYILYAASLASASGTGGGRHSLATINLNGIILNADFVDSPEGGYTDTLTVSINP